MDKVFVLGTAPTEQSYFRLRTASADGAIFATPPNDGGKSSRGAEFRGLLQLFVRNPGGDDEAFGVGGAEFKLGVDRRYPPRVAEIEAQAVHFGAYRV